MNSVYDNGGVIGTALNFGATDFYQQTIPRGEAEYTTSGTYSWTAPAGVTSVDVVCVGGGGGGGGLLADAFGAGGGGGGLGYKNNISVVPGNSYTVVVGSGGAGSGGNGTSGGNSYFIDSSTVAGLGGIGGGVVGTNGGAGGSYVGDGGGNGGTGGTASSADAGGGGGAGGYSGNGGAGANLNTAGSSGSGGGGGGGGAGGANDTGGGGGGVGIYGEGTSGTGGSYNGTDGGAGGGGSGGSDGNDVPSNGDGDGGSFGGGGGGSDFFGGEVGTGGGGAVRIIWGGNRAFPSTNTADSAGDTTVNDNKKNSGIWDLNAVYNELSGPLTLSTDSLSSWTISAGSDVRIDASNGNPGNCIETDGGGYAYIDTGITNWNNKKISFDVYIKSGTNQLGNFFFACNSSGSGQHARLEARVTQQSGFSSTTSWTVWADEATGGNTGADSWRPVEIEINGSGQATLKISGFTFQSGYSITNNGGYVSVHGDSSIVSGCRFDNIVITDL